MRLLLRSPHPMLSYSLLVALSVMLVSPLAHAEASPDLGNNDIFKQIDAYVAGQPSPVTAYDITNQFAFAADDPSFGTAVQFGASITSSEIAVAALSSTHFVVAYERSDQGQAIVGSVSGTTITYGIENTFNGASSNAIGVTALSSTHFVVVYIDNGNSGHGTARVGEVSGTTISSYGPENAFNAVSTGRTHVAALSSTHFVAIYEDVPNSGHGTARVGEVSGTTISSYGAENVFEASTTRPHSIAALSSTHFVIVYGDGNNSNHGTAIVGQVSGTTISSYGAKNVFSTAALSISSGTLSVAALSSTHFVVAYRDQDNSNRGTAIVGQVSGITISSYGAENVFNSQVSNRISVDALDASTFAVGYYSGSFNSRSSSCTSGSCNYESIVGDVSSTTISAYSNSVAVDDSQGVPGNLALANLGSFVVAYTDTGDSSGKAVVSSSGDSLPIELTHFSAQLDHTYILLRWTTASETNNAGFDIQYQSVGPDDQAPAAKLGNWHSATFVTGYGTTTEAQAYTHRLQGFAPGTYRFRLKQIDFDGTFAYSPVVEVVIELSGTHELTEVYPNPFTSEAQFTLVVRMPQKVTVEVFNMLGQRVLRVHEGELGAGTVHRFTVDGGTLPRGSYVLRTRGETFDASQTMILVS